MLQKIALLCKTRGIIFLSCFQDCDRSDAISLVTPRYSGKATPAQFMQHFPLIGDFSESDLQLLAKRYTTSSGDVNYQALDRDITEAAQHVPPPTSTNENTQNISIPRINALTPLGGKVISTDRRRREVALMETRQSVDIMERLRALVSERRLRLSDCFLDFDRLRKGDCTMTQLRTVFTVLGIAFEPIDFKNLGDLYCSEDGLFRYRELCEAVCEINALNITSWDMELPMTPTMSTAHESPRPGSRIRFKAQQKPQSINRLAELEVWIRNRADTRSLDLKRCFQDFDKVCKGHVTRTQFARIMNMLSCELRPADSEILCQAYCDTDNGEEFNYMDFVGSLWQFEPMEQAQQTMNLQQISRRPKYFDRSGESISPCPFTPLASLLDPTIAKARGGGLWSARACTR